MTVAIPPRPERRYWEPRVNVQEEPMRRRRFIATAAAATGVNLLPGLLAAPALAAPDRTNGSTTLPNAITDLGADVWRNNAAYVDPMHAPARTDLMQVAEWLWAQATVLTSRARRHPYTYRRALNLEAEAARSLAAMNGDAFNYDEATRLYGLATGAALRAGNHELAAWITCSRAYMPFYAGNHRRVLELCYAALEHLDRADRPGGRAAVCAHSMRARSMSAVRDRDGTAEALRQAYGAMARYADAGSAALPADHHPQRFAWVKLRLQTADCFAALGDRDRHRNAVDAARAQTSLSAMHKPILTLGEAETEHDPATAAHTALGVLKDLRTVPNPILGRARAVAARAYAKAPRSPEVEALRLYVVKQHAR